MATLLFVHGACVRDGAWWWSRMREPLARRGVATAAVELPSCEGGGDLHDDAAAVRRACDAADGPVTLLGHSYGGLVVTEAGVHPAVDRLVYLASFLPDERESLASLGGDEPAPWLDVGDDGTVGVHPALTVELFLQDCDEEAVAGAVARLARQSLAAFAQPPAAVAWRDRPSRYVVCGHDLAIPAALQRERAARATEVVEVPTGHHPFLSQPELLAGVLVP